MPSPRSRVELGPTVARHYDLFMDLISIGYYPFLVRKIVDRMDIRLGQSVLDLGSGTGRNDCFIAQKVGRDGSILGLDINREMLDLSRRRCRSHLNIEFREQRIEAPLSYQQEFDKVFVAFVLHGFENAQKLGIISNAYRALKPGGVFCILDYNAFDLNGLWFPIRWVFTHAECQLAAEFLRLDLKEMLSTQGFTSFEEVLFVRGYLRLLKATK